MSRTRQLFAFLVATALYCALALSAAPAHSASAGFVPFQAAHAGNWYDPTQSGAGFDVLPYNHDGANFGALVTYYGGAQPGGQPVWFAAQLGWSGGAPVSGGVYLSGRTFGDSGDSGPAQRVGTVTFTTDGQTCSALAADIVFDTAPFAGITQHFGLVPLIQFDAAACFTCPAVDFGPNDERCVSP